MNHQDRLDMGDLAMDNIIYRELSVGECKNINEMDPSQFIGKAWREVNGKLQLVEINYQDIDWPNGYTHHYKNLRKTIIEGGSALGAFDFYNKLIGFATINREIFGDKFKYVLLDQLFITLEHRGKGIGRQLFLLSAKVARKWNADKIYICAGSAEETIAFYNSIGCSKAVEINKQLFDNDPRDFQMEYLL